MKKIKRNRKSPPAERTRSLPCLCGRCGIEPECCRYALCTHHARLAMKDHSPPLPRGVWNDEDFFPSFNTALKNFFKSPLKEE